MAAVCQKEERGEQLVQYIDEGIEEVTSRLADVSEEDKPTVVELYSDMNVSVKQYDHWMIPSGAKNPAGRPDRKDGRGRHGADAFMESGYHLYWKPFRSDAIGSFGKQTDRKRLVRYQCSEESSGL